MSETETVKTELEARFPFLAGAVRVQRERRLWVDVAQDKFAEVFEHLVKEHAASPTCAPSRAWTLERSWASSTTWPGTAESWPT